MIRMQLQDLPLLLAGALGAAITGMVAPGLSFLFGEIQKVARLEWNYLLNCPSQDGKILRFDLILFSYVKIFQSSSNTVRRLYERF